MRANRELIYYISGCTFPNCPVGIVHARFYDDNGFLVEDVSDTINYEKWGEPYSFYRINDENMRLIPYRFELIWDAILEKTTYSINMKMPVSETYEYFWTIPSLEHLVVGIGPYGTFALWANGKRKSVLLNLGQADKTNRQESLHAAKTNEQIKQHQPQCYLFVKYMQQFTYRYLMLFKHWDKDKKQWCSDGKPSQIDRQSLQTESNKEENIPELDYIEETLFDGTHDKLHDDGLINYHQAGKPKKLAIKWHIKKSEFTAYFWFEDEEICSVFDRFYGVHPETKTDFMIRIDAEQNKYELALYRYGLKAPQVISESAYQLLVFKNKFEYFRSENYNQPRGAWIW